jgi:type II secretory pathway component GspD/PulD (secretin)
MNRFSFPIVLIALSFLSAASFAAPKTAAATSEKASTGTVPFQFKNSDLLDVLQAYTKISGQKFVVDPSVHGKVTILSSHPVTIEEAFNLLSSSLATNQTAISVQGDTMLVASARNMLHGYLPVVSELPAMKPERMVTWVIELHNVSADQVNRRLRILPSRDGELVPIGRNRILISDWISNLYKIRDLMATLDQPGIWESKDSTPELAQKETAKDSEKTPALKTVPTESPSN